MLKPVFCILLLISSSVFARPEIIKEGILYYSDDFFQTGIVKDIIAEKNYEEVYQFYTYYEVIYDAEERVKVFKEYKKGEVIFEEHYQYAEDGTVTAEKVVGE
ncbi:hypothetical protein QUF74_03465 [Candidatus Halobeggiatoa sp. HSG11]|nr:hypothetical protein [Candidatus Halobeggiatoa sp. HSG11]